MRVIIEPVQDWVRDHHEHMTPDEKIALEVLREWLHRMSGPAGVRAREPTSQGERRH